MRSLALGNSGSKLHEIWYCNVKSNIENRNEHSNFADTGFSTQFVMVWLSIGRQVYEWNCETINFTIHWQKLYKLFVLDICQNCKGITRQTQVKFYQLCMEILPIKYCDLALTSVLSDLIFIVMLPWTG